jgi:hypothetical protein
LRKNKELFKNIDLIKVAKLLFYGAIFTLPFQISTIISQPEIYLSGQSNHFNNATLYLTDILIILSAVFFFPVKSKIEIGDKIMFFTLIALGILIFILNIKSDIFPIYWLVFRLLTFAITYLLLVNRIATKESLYKVLLLAGSIQAIIAIMQFTNQRSIGLEMLGEPNLSASNIAKIDVNDTKMIRSYGTMPHPNVLAGLLTIAIILGAKFKRWMPFLGLCTIGIVLTFSRSAILALATCAILFALFNTKSLIVFCKKHYLISLTTILLIATMGFFTYPTLKSHLLSTYEINERFEQLPIAISVIEENFLGIGWQNYTNLIQKYTENKIDPWEYQPVHNIYLLATSELGIIGIALILFMLFYTTVSTKDKYIKYAIIAVCIIGLFDHYPYTLYQGQLLTIILLSLSLSKDIRPEKI